MACCIQGCANQNEKREWRDWIEGRVRELCEYHYQMHKRLEFEAPRVFPALATLTVLAQMLPADSPPCRRDRILKGLAFMEARAFELLTYEGELRPVSDTIMALRNTDKM